MLKPYLQQKSEKLIREMPADIAATLSHLRARRQFDCELAMRSKCLRINQYCHDSGIDCCIIGVSGGIDSAVTLALLQQASQQPNSAIKRIVPVFMPLFVAEGASNQEYALSKGKKLCQHLGCAAITVDVSHEHHTIQSKVEKALACSSTAWAKGQLVSYIRAPVFYALTAVLAEQNFSSLVVGTTNRDEGAYLGYFGKASDGMVDLQLIADFHKSEVYALARYFALPEELIASAPSGDTYNGLSDEEIIGTSYDFIELYLLLQTLYSAEERKISYENWLSSSQQLYQLAAQYIEEMHAANKHKYYGHSPAIFLDVYERAFPGGWKKQKYHDEARYSYDRSLFVGEMTLDAIAEENLCRALHDCNADSNTVSSQVGFMEIDSLLSNEVSQLLLQAFASTEKVTTDHWGKQKTVSHADEIGSYRAALYNEELSSLLFNRLGQFIKYVQIFDEQRQTDWHTSAVWRAVSINPLWRLIEYQPGNLLLPHYDAPYALNFYQKSLMSVVIFLNDVPTDCGGTFRLIHDPQRRQAFSARQFNDWSVSPTSEQILQEVQPQQGKALLFDHRWLHDSAAYTGAASKIILRTDLIFEKCAL